MSALLECARSLSLGTKSLRQTAARDEEEAPLFDGELCASAGASSAAGQQQQQASEAAPAQPRGSVSQDCRSAHAAAGGSSWPIPSKAACDEPWLTLQVSVCRAAAGSSTLLRRVWTAFVRAN